MQILRRSTVIIFTVFVMAFISAHTGLAEYAQPDYAPWGKAAVLQAKQEFPNQKVVDYKYEGKVFISENRTQYNFILTLESNGNKADIRSYVIVNPKENQLIKVYFD